ncbi:glycosyltransferase family 61 protein [Pedobacter gandavensis]|uniref:glycosyltransferase family 61 protein n=1 Tax=Pedobacter gandavensis TaxID=2679963 RepID=UPI002479E010|nr:glycosyltransferase family 61 protein [Pedobacter gandavensis]WGQ07988.1 glycosyltransferase family 61 protein [Pedobacter gandavensis]
MTKNIMDSYTITHAMPENYVAGELDFCKAEFSYDTYKVQLMDFQDCVVNRTGFLYETKKFKLNEYSLLDVNRYTKCVTHKHYLKKVLIKPKRKLGPGKYLLVHDEWTNEHYHWFCDLLPRLFVIKEQLKDYILLLPDSSYVRNIGLQSLEFFELQPAAIEFIKEKELVKMKNVSILTHTCLTGYVNAKIIREMKAFTTQKLKIDPAAPASKIYISRDKARYRKILNEPEIQSVVKDFGYEVIRYEDLSWKEQIAKTSSAESLVSIHGAGLINMFYMQEHGSVLEFRRNKIYHNQCFWHLSQALQLKYYYLFGTPDDDSLVIEGDGCNLTVDPNLLSKTLKAMADRQA